MIQTRSFAFGRDFSLRHATGYFGMRLLPFVLPRNAVASTAAFLINRRQPRRPLRELSETERTHSLEVVSNLRNSGFSMLPPLLTQPEIAEIRAFLDTKQVHAGRRSFRPDAPPADVRRASYALPDILDCPHVLAAINRPEILHIAQSYLGCAPTISSIGIHLTVPSSSGVVDVQRFHRDPDDWRFIKLFVYLTDVDSDCGPHEFIASSHRTSGRLISKPYEDPEVLRRYGNRNMRRVLGPRGTTFIADTWGIHKGGAGTRPRLMLQIQYSVLPVAKFNYHPVRLDRPAAVDRYTNRLLLA
jgi:hypothetical protein